jgi:hypothetical protein
MDRLNLITKDCFGALLQIRQAESSELPAPEQVQERLRRFVSDMMRKSRDEGLPQQDVDDIAYALVALADELARGPAVCLQRCRRSDGLGAGRARHGQDDPGDRLTVVTSAARCAGRARPASHRPGS